MEESAVRIVTDGSIDLAPETIRTLGIHVVPRRWQAGRTVYESSEATPLPVLGQTLSPAKARALNSTVNTFLHAYRQFPTEAILSIHPTETLEEAAHYARLARNLLTGQALTTYYDARGALRRLSLPQEVSPPARIHIFDARTIDLGVRLLVTVAAQAARDGSVLGQVILLLRRLQDEQLQTYVLTRNTTQLSVADAPPAGALASLRRLLPGAESLLRLERASGRFKVVAQGWGLVKSLAANPDLLHGLPQPCEIWIRQRGYDGQVQSLAAQLQSACQAEQVHIEPDSLAAAPFFTTRYLELVFGPTPETIERIIKFTHRVWGTYGVTGTLSGTY